MSSTTTTKIAAGIATMTAISMMSVTFGTTAAQARPAAATKCPGHYKVNDATPHGKVSKKWTVEVSAVTEQGTTCANAHAVAGQYARAVCGECAGSNNRTISGYRYKYQVADIDEGYVTAKKGSITVKFFWSTEPAS